MLLPLLLQRLSYLIRHVIIITRHHRYVESPSADQAPKDPVRFGTRVPGDGGTRVPGALGTTTTTTPNPASRPRPLPELGTLLDLCTIA